MVRGAGDVSLIIPLAAHRVGVLKLPLDGQRRTELRDEVLFRAGRIARGPVAGTERLDSAVRPSAVMVLLRDHRVGAVVRVDGGRGVPAEAERTEKCALRAEAHQMSLLVVVDRQRTEEDGAVGRDGGRRTRIVEDTAGPWLVGSGIDAFRRAHAASPWIAVLG